VTPISRVISVSLRPGRKGSLLSQFRIEKPLEKGIIAIFRNKQQGSISKPFMNPSANSCLLALSVCFSVATYRAQAVEVRNFENEAVVAEKQDAPEWCWAASVQAICKHLGLPLAQSEIVQSTYGIPMNIALRAPNDLAQGLARITASRGLQFFASPYYDSIDKERVQWELKVGYPVLTFIRNDAFSGHAIVIYAMTKDDVGDDYSIKYWDPWPAARQVNDTKLSVIASHLHGYCFFRIRYNGQILKAPQTSSEPVFDEDNEEVSKIKYEDIARYVNDSRDGFSSIRGSVNQDPDPGDLEVVPGVTNYKCTVQPLGGSDATVTKDASAVYAPKVDWTLHVNFYYGTRLETAKQVYSKLNAVMLTSLPEWKFVEKSRQGTDDSRTKTLFSHPGGTSISVDLWKHQTKRDLQHGSATYIVSWSVHYLGT
jgi:hypothetical protein